MPLPPPPSSKTRKRKSSPSSSPVVTNKSRKYNRKAPIPSGLVGKITNKNRELVPDKSLGRVRGLIENYKEHNNIAKSQEFYNNWRKEEAKQRKILRRAKSKGSIDISDM